MTHNRKTAVVEVSKEEIDRDDATVYCVLTFVDGNRAKEEIDLVKKDGRWFITIDQGRKKARLLKQIESNARTLSSIALGSNDFETIFPLHRDYLDEIAAITAQNPKAIWPGLVDKEFKLKKETLPPTRRYGRKRLAAFGSFRTGPHQDRRTGENAEVASLLAYNRSKGKCMSPPNFEKASGYLYSQCP